MKVGFFTSAYPRATDTFIRREVTGFRARNFEVQTYSVRETGAEHDVDNEIAREKAATYCILPIKPLGLVMDFTMILLCRPLRLMRTITLAWKTSRRGIRGRAVQSAYILEAIVLARQLERDRIDHLHNHFGDSSGNVTLFAALLLDIPFSISIHGPHIFFDPYSWALGVKARHARFIACIGFFCRSQMMLYTDKSDWGKLEIVRCGVDHEIYEYRPPAAKIQSLLYVGRLEVEKGLPILFSSLSLLKARGCSPDLVLIGDGPDRRHLEAEADSLGIADQLDFRGFASKDEVASALRESDLFVSPSFAEGIPVTLMEAMAIGVPVVATNVGGVNELVVNGVTGLVVHSSDDVGLADAIERYIEEPGLCRELSANARAKVVAEFDIEVQVERLARLIGGEDS